MNTDISSNNGRRLVGRVDVFTGWDGIFYMLAMLLGAWARRRLARRCAKIYLKPGNPFHGMDPTRHTLVLELPYGAFRVVDIKGNVEPYHEIAGV